MTELKAREHSPSPDKFRVEWKLLNGVWDFSFDEPIYDKKITVPFSWACPLSGVGEKDKKGTGYYRKYVEYDKGGNKLFLVFEGVDYECEVTVNGKNVGSHIGGYSCFEFDVTDVWEDKAKNEICVKATDNDLPHQMYGKQGYGNSRGIWQDVYLQQRPESYIDKFVITTKCDGTVKIDADVCGNFDKMAVETEYGIFSSDTNSVSFKIDNPVLWNTENPYLYDCKIKLYNGNSVDEVYTYFGIREVGYDDFDGKKYITLNGKPVFIIAALDQSFHSEGFYTLPDADYAKEEILRAKKLGLNALRIHVKTEDRRKLYWADKLGIMIIEDIPCFWGDPEEIAREHFEKQMYEIVDRDINHPAVIYWVIFNETWGLWTRYEDDKIEYRKETQEWVRRLYHDLKKYDSTRLVEDISPNSRDHVETDVNTWHFYLNGYENVKAECDRVSEKFVCGSEENYIGGNRMTDIPIMNSECGNYWRVEGSAGDSDLSWHYKYMINEFRLHERIGGYVFTELKDVPNEFNGLYRIDDTRKLFGFESYVEDMCINDIHSMDYIGYDYKPMDILEPNEIVNIPLFVSSMTDKHHGKSMKLLCQTELRKEDGSCCIYNESIKEILYHKYGTTSLGNITLNMPDENGILVLKLYLKDEEDNIVMRNFLLFDIVKDCGHISIDNLKTEGFIRSWKVQSGNKLNCIGKGCIYLDIDKNMIPDYKNSITISFEASSRRVLKRDINNNAHDSSKIDMDYMHGYVVDRGENPNCFFMTGGKKHSSNIKIYAEQYELDNVLLEDCPADSTGCLSWAYQEDVKHLDEAGSYGYLIKVNLDRALLDKLPDNFKVKIDVDGGISIFGRRSGAYPTDIAVTGF